ncbi:MAG: c-type cytochrome domain-containing protein, partial [Planctomycetota bacterium]|nr:c-type cytochrome domain-containing protein [Planctomycetota bacterium]
MQVLALAAAPATESLEFFEKKIRPVLVERCFKCHGPKAKGGLRLDGRAGMLKGGE